MNKTNFAHVRPKDLNGGYTIAYTNIPRNTSGDVHYALARCKSSDNFNKKIGRMIAEGRLAAGKYETVFAKSSRYGDIVRDIITEVESKKCMAS